MWLVNILLPRIANSMGIESKHVGGGWLTGISNALMDKENVELYVCSPNSHINKYKIEMIERNLYNCTYQEENECVYNQTIKDYLEELVQIIKPDIIHAFGTEYPRTCMMSEIAKKLNIPFCISITGMVGPYSQKYFGKVPYKYRNSILRNIMAKVLPINTLNAGKKDFESRAVFEKKAIETTKYILGRTSWDDACTNQINQNVIYFKCNETLRDSFYKNTWSYHKCERYTIMVPQMGYPIKGFEVFLEGLKIIKKRYPDVRVFVPGMSVFAIDNRVKRKIAIQLSDYTIYLEKLINRYDLNDNIIFCGPLDEAKMKEYMLKSNVFVLPSAIENSPNSLGEAMLLGVPSVASCVGGVQSIMVDKKEGFIYPYDEPYMMAYYVMRLFESEELMNEISKAAKNRAKNLYDKEQNANRLTEIYNEILILEKKKEIYNDKKNDR